VYQNDKLIRGVIPSALERPASSETARTMTRTEARTTESLSQLRKQIDECDDNIIQELAKRMRIAREIGTYKKEHGITVLQAGRYNEILEKRGAQGEQCGMDAEFMKKIFEAIHEESVRQQMEIINK
jgi:chorismate mutase